MTRSREHLEELLKLPAEERSKAAEALLESLEQDEPDADAAAAWAEEIELRVADGSRGISAGRVFAEGRARLQRDE